MADKAVRAGERTDAAALLAGLVTVGAWGSAFVGIRAAGVAFSPGALALGRLVVSSAILGTVALVRREPLPARRDLLAIAIYGVLWLVGYSVALNAAERHVDAGTASMVVSTGPILIAFLAGLFLREGLPRGLFAGCAVSFAGCFMISLATIQLGSSGGLGILLCFVAVVGYSVAVIVQKPVLQRVSSFQVTWLGCVAATIACLPCAPALATEASSAGVTAIGWTIYLGAVPTALGFATGAFALRRTSAGRMGSILYLNPVVAILLGWALLGEAPSGLAAAGGALCIAGVAVARRQGANRPRDGSGSRGLVATIGRLR